MKLRDIVAETSVYATPYEWAGMRRLAAAYFVVWLAVLELEAAFWGLDRG